MQFSELKTEAFRRLNESSSTPVYFTEDDVELALNEGYAELSDATEWYEEYYVITLLSHLPYYDLRTLLPETFLAPKRLYNQATCEWLGTTSLRELDYHTTRQWETLDGEPCETLMRGMWWLNMHPRASTDGGKVKFYYTALPEDMTQDTDEPGFPIEFHKYIIEYALYDLFSQDGETKKALEHWRAYLEGERLLQVSVGGRVAMDRSANV